MRTKLGLLLLLWALAVAAQQTGSPLTNADVIKMVKAGQPEATVVDAIASHETQFDLSAAGLQGLNQAGVSSKVIRAMLAESKRKQAAEAAALPNQNSEAASAQKEDASAAGPMSQTGMTPQMMEQMQNMPRTSRERLMTGRSVLQCKTAGRRA